jgi:hypothetical protein
MPSSPDYSEYVRMKRIQAASQADAAISSTKNRAPKTYASYQPAHKIQSIPFNVFRPARLTPGAPIIARKL